MCAKLSKIDAAGDGAGRRRSSGERVPVEAAVQERDAAGRSDPLRLPEPDLVGRSTAHALCGRWLLCQLLKSAAKRSTCPSEEISQTQPNTVSLNVLWTRSSFPFVQAREGVSHAAAVEKLLHALGREHRSAVGQDPERLTAH